ncbi:hypothetical protein LLE49_22205 [Alicyclobacillus tolerans]|uniref:hypothetical protein n=1 Tax=Alicyclobacillus tolerans TaxID=90970 RepID=UPI001F295903|nr:hypothetical protein [Alicyclobacillus tolerans]MCF8567435.1 hypothetical protein [Alicyclobacillus tolerans]
MKSWFLRQGVRLQEMKQRALSGSLEEMTARGWMFVAVVIGIVMVFGPMVVSLVTKSLGSSINTVSSGFNFSNLGS